MDKPSEQESRERQRAAASAGRAAGYCWVRFGDRRQHCTAPPDHPGKHYDKFVRATLRALAEATAPKAQARGSAR
ncbi:hypothetical protein AB0O68_15795 [Streptomyces sp. NPDC087512]|uniref:hypothetical protein n=1 Tax=Streptomyces sp. NPDC087512 TaxID=3155059 RepID=UPI00341BEE51